MSAPRHIVEYLTTKPWGNAAVVVLLAAALTARALLAPAPLRHRGALRDDTAAVHRDLIDSYQFANAGVDERYPPADELADELNRAGPLSYEPIGDPAAAREHGIIYVLVDQGRTRLRLLERNRAGLISSVTGTPSGTQLSWGG